MLQFIAVFNIFLGLIGFAWLIYRTARRRHEYPDEILLLLYATIAIFFALLITSLSVFIAGGVAVNVLVITAVKLFVLYVLYKTRATKYRTGTRQHDGNPGDDQNKDVG